MRQALPLLLVLGCALALQACNTFLSFRPSLPVEASQLGGGLPSGYELQAVLTVARGVAKREYLMVLRTDSDEVRLALMTPQGLPVFVVTGSGDAIFVEQQLHTDLLLTPDMVVRYLIMVYGNGELLARSSAADWRLEFMPGRRSFSTTKGVLGTIEVSYLGEAPWYTEVAVTDSRDDTRMMIHTLEWFDVVPE